MPTHTPKTPNRGPGFGSINMYYGAKSELFDLAKKLRANQTKTEATLWNGLCNKQLNGFKFRRQHPISLWIADFYCHKIRYVIELDGEYHLTKTQKNLDDERDKSMHELGIFVRRFNDYDILEEFDATTQKIFKDCDTLNNNLLL